MKHNYFALWLLAAAVALPATNTRAEIHSGTMSSDALTWQVDDMAGTLTITGNGEIQVLGTSTPWARYADDIRQIVIGNGVGLGNLTSTKCPNVTSVTISSDAALAPEATTRSISTIFGTQVRKYVIGAGVKTIGPLKFYGCTEMEELHLPSTLDSIGDNAFAMCDKLKAIHITDIDRWLRIRYGAFANPLSCSNEQMSETGQPRHLYLSGSDVLNITLPEGVTSIAPYQFFRCLTLQSITLPSTIKSIGIGAFAWCSQLYHINIPEGVSDIKANTFIGLASRLANPISISLPSTLKTIGREAFAMANIKSLTIPEGVDSIAEYAFMEASMASVSLPASLRVVESNAFGGCAQLKQANFASIESLCNIRFKDKTANPIAICKRVFVNGNEVKDVVVPQGVTRISSYAFTTATLGSVQLPAGLKEIETGAFESSTLRSINIPQGMQSIGTNAFKSSSLQQIDLSNYMGTIGYFAFNDCQQLQRITLPAQNPYRYTSDDGKVIFSRDSIIYRVTREVYDETEDRWIVENKDSLYYEPTLVSVLPTVTELVIPYPVSGGIMDVSNVRDKGMSYVNSALSGTFKNLTRLELPCTWNATVGELNWFFAPRLKELVLRSAKPTPFGQLAWWKQYNGNAPAGITDDSGNTIPFNTEDPKIYVFDYAMADYEAVAKSEDFYWSPNGSYTITYNNYMLYGAKFQPLQLPSEQRYLQETLPTYRSEQTVERQQGTDAYYLWSADWETMLQTDLPDYFTSDVVKKSGYDPSEYRFDILKRYLTEEKRQAMPDSVIQCMDGIIHVSHYFDTNDYLKWYFTPDSLPIPEAESTRGSVAVVNANAAWDVPAGTYYYVTPPTPITNPSLTFNVRMLPGIKYDLYLLVAPHLSSDGTQCADSLLSRIRPAMLSWNGTTYSTKNGTNTDISYTGNVQRILLFEDVEVLKDHINKVIVSSNTSASQRSHGYTNEMALLSVVAVPKDAPDGILPNSQQPRTKGQQPKAIYDLQGRRVLRPTKGLYIVGGKIITLP